MTLKEARAKCRELAIQNHVLMWPLSWNKVYGYYPDTYKASQYFICFVGKNGQYMYASDEDAKKHNLKGNIKSKYR